MPKVGMEPKRRDALVRAAVAEIGEAGSLDVTVAQIARRAGMSSGLAHHYFGGKDQMLLAAMGHILKGFSSEVRNSLRGLSDPMARLRAVIHANFAPGVFLPQKTSAWLSFYALAKSQPEAAHLMHLYQCRLNSTLLHDLRALSTTPEAAAKALAAQIDGAYLRAALAAPTDVAEAAKAAEATTLLTLNALTGESR